MSAARKILLVSGILLLVTALSGCSAVGTTKPAALQITSTPEASVFLDGKHVGKSPFFSDQLKSKEYLIKLSSGEASYVEKVTLSQSTLTVINRELNNNFMAQSGEILALQKGSKGLFITSMPNEASISIDGQSQGKTPQKIASVQDGDHKIVISKQGYQDREFVVKTTGEYQLIADVTLASEIAKGEISAPAPLSETAKVEVLTTPQGFLRVRKEASTSSPEIGRVKDGDKLEQVQETPGWVEVKFAGKQGWVSSQYVKKLSQT